MAKLLVIKSSILGDHSSSGLLINELLTAAKKQDPAQHVVERDLGVAPLAQLDGEILGGFASSEGRSARQQAAVELSERLIAEIEEADRLVIGVPMYNFGVPTQLKTWFDYICRAGVTFKYSETGPVGLLTNKPVLLVVTTGGLHRDTATDLALAHIRTVLNFVGLQDIQVAYAQGLGMGPEARESGLVAARESMSGFLPGLA
ncbi:MAG: FMN-dependent NADH-azoreductase [Aeromonadaceae bacterium]